MVPKPIAEGGEEERCSLAADSCQRQQNASDDSLGSSLHYDVNDRFPTSDAEREGSLAITIRHQQNHFLSRAQNEWDHDQAKREAASIGGEAFETQHDQPVNDNTKRD